MSYNMPRKKGRPSTKLNKLIDIRNSINNQDLINEVDDLIQRLESNRNTYNDTKRGIEFLKSNEDTYINTDDYIKKKTLMLSNRLGKGEIKQVRSSNTLLNMLLSGKKQTFKTKIHHIKVKVKANKPQIITETAFKSRVKDIILKFDKRAKGFKPFDKLFNHIQDIKHSMDENGAITLQLNIPIIVGFSDGTTDTLHIHSDRTNILINSEE